VTVKGIGRGGLVSELEVAVGVTAEGPPALSLHPRVFGAGRLGPVAAGGLVQPTGDPAFDQRYRLRGRAAAVDLLDPGLRERLEEVWGWLGVWTNPGGARFRTAGRPAVIAALLPAASVAAGDPGAVEPLLRLCDLVCDVADRAR
jgi:hypothetical protein